MDTAPAVTMSGPTSNANSSCWKDVNVRHTFSISYVFGSSPYRKEMLLMWYLCAEGMLGKFYKRGLGIFT